jgi:hypothetical protein
MADYVHPAAQQQEHNKNYINNLYLVINQVDRPWSIWGQLYSIVNLFFTFRSLL